MQKCTSCGFNLSGDRQVCPLCGKKLEHHCEEECYDVFPKVPVKVTYHLIFKISTFAAIFGIVVVNIINKMFIPHFKIYLPLTLGIIGAWLIINVGFKKRKNIPKNILYEAVISIVLCLLWDYFSGWRGWSVGYVLPSTSAALVIFYFVMGIADRSRLTTYTGYFMISEIGIIVCFILNLLGVFYGVAEYFAVMAVAVGLLLFLAQVVFRGKGFFSELHRWLHL